jgi:hypothetical protein
LEIATSDLESEILQDFVKIESKILSKSSKKDENYTKLIRENLLNYKNENLKETEEDWEYIGFHFPELTDLFDKYKTEPNEISLDGMQKFANDLGTKVDDFLFIAICWKLHFQQSDKIKRKEFVEGFTKLELKNIKQIREYLKKNENEFKSTHFSAIYKYAFEYQHENVICLNFLFLILFFSLSPSS